MSDEMHGYSVKLGDLEGFKNGVADFAANYEVIVSQLTGAGLQESRDKQLKVHGFPRYGGKSGEFFDSCETFVSNYADLMHLLLRVNTAIKIELTNMSNGLVATRDTYAELESRQTGRQGSGRAGGLRSVAEN